MRKLFEFHKDSFGDLLIFTVNYKDASNIDKVQSLLRQTNGIGTLYVNFDTQEVHGLWIMSKQEGAGISVDNIAQG